MVLALATVLAGMIIAANLFIGRRRYVGTEPHCRRCGYLLRGLESSRCPECGSPLSPGNIVFGQRTRRWKPFIAAWLLIALVGSLFVLGIVGYANKVDWYHYDPAYLVLKDAASSNLAVSHRAWTELIRRDAAGALSTKNRDRLVRLALTDQQKSAAPYSSLDTDVINYLSARILAGDLPQDQQNRIFDQAMRLRLVIRPHVIAGDQVPYKLIHDGLLPTGPLMWTKISMAGAAIDGKPIAANTGGYSAFSSSGSGTMGSSIASPPPGKHTLTLTFHVEVFNSRFDVPNTPLYRTDRFFTNDFDVLAAEPADFVRPFVDPAAAAGVKSAIVPSSFRYSRSQKSLVGDLDLRIQPANLAFDVLAIFGGAEHPMGQVTYNPADGVSSCSVFGNLASPPPAQIDLLLRPSAEAARQTVDLTSYWNAEIRCTNVPVQFTP